MTKSVCTLLSLMFLATALATSALAQTDAQKAFATIKNMPGSWDGKTSDGRDVQVAYKITARGSAVMSEILGDHDMITVFNLDGQDKLLMTYYCSAGNQPRMQATLSPGGKTITFNFIDATNLASSDAGHMRRMVLTLLDENHHTEEWTYIDHGKERTELFDLHRKL